MGKEKEVFRPYVEVVSKEGVMVRSIDDHLSNLREDIEWGGEPEIIALSGIYNCFFEVYKTSEPPDVVHLPNVIGNTKPTIRLFYRRSHYSIVRSNGVGNQLFNFEGLVEGELERQMEILSMSEDPKNYSEAEVHFLG